MLAGRSNEQAAEQETKETDGFAKSRASSEAGLACAGLGYQLELRLRGIT
jgi:hypothetical protein